MFVMQVTVVTMSTKDSALYYSMSKLAAQHTAPFLARGRCNICRSSRVTAAPKLACKCWHDTQRLVFGFVGLLLANMVDV